MEIRNPTGDDELEQAWAVLARAFNWPPGDNERFIKSAGPLDRCLVAVDRGVIGGFSRVRPFGQHYGGRSVPMAGVSPVGVDPDFRGRGVASQLTSGHFGPARERGEWISGLYPATTKLYRGVGYEVAGIWSERVVPIRSLQQLPRPAGLAARRATPDDWGAIADCYARIAPGRPGWLDRPDVWWYRLFVERAEGLQVYVVDGEGEDGAIGGYMAYRHLSDPARQFGYVIAVGDLVTDDVDVLLALWRLVASSASMVQSVRINGPAENPLLLLLPEQDLTAGPELRYMLRIVDAARAVNARGFPPVTLTVDIEVIDKHCDWNGGRWRLAVSEGHGSLEKGGAGTVSIGIGAFASLYAGYSSARTLASTGLLRGASPRDLDALDTLFASTTPWMPDFF